MSFPNSVSQPSFGFFKFLEVLLQVVLMESAQTKLVDLSYLTPEKKMSLGHV